MYVIESTRAVFSLFAVVEVSTSNSESIENLCYLPTLPGRVKFQKGVSVMEWGGKWGVMNLFPELFNRCQTSKKPAAKTASSARSS